MQKSSFLLLLFLPAFGLAQTTEGVVTYLETIHLKLETPEGMSEEAFRKMVPSEQTALKTLLFSAKESHFSDAAEQAPGGETVNFSGNDDNGDVEMDFTFQRPENYHYLDRESGERIEFKEFFGRKFLIKETPKRLKWKITAEQKIIAGYPCQKAILQDTARQVEAWFSAQIPVSIGPADYSDLPGLILEVSSHNGERTYVAEKVELKALDKDAITKPNKGKSVTREEFIKIRDEKLKEMGVEGGGGGTIKMIIRN